MAELVDGNLADGTVNGCSKERDLTGEARACFLEDTGLSTKIIPLHYVLPTL